MKERYGVKERCNGKIEVYLNPSAPPNHSFDADDLRKLGDEKGTGKLKGCDKNDENRHQCRMRTKNLEFVKVMGNCCWQFGSHSRTGMGEVIDIVASEGVKSGGWPIKKVVLTECIQI